jgi:hypothetical protein|tara:strand:+ start:2318 stop:2419 length:102 start_codon:yes stop_codon:yes gene_type:complete
MNMEQSYSSGELFLRNKNKNNNNNKIIIQINKK